MQTELIDVYEFNPWVNGKKIPNKNVLKIPKCKSEIFLEWLSIFTTVPKILYIDCHDSEFSDEYFLVLFDDTKSFSFTKSCLEFLNK